MITVYLYVYIVVGKSPVLVTKVYTYTDRK